MPDLYDYNTLLCRLKAAQIRNKELESGERYIQLKKFYEKERKSYESRIMKFMDELAAAHKETIRVQLLVSGIGRYVKGNGRYAEKVRPETPGYGDAGFTCRKSERSGS